MKRLIVVTISIILLIGCDDFNFNPKGRYIGNKVGSDYLILDTKSGDVRILMDDQIVKVPHEEELEQIKTFTSRKIPNIPIEIRAQFEN